MSKQNGKTDRRTLLKILGRRDERCFLEFGGVDDDRL
jgi:hypothetical protein